MIVVKCVKIYWLRSVITFENKLQLLTVNVTFFFNLMLHTISLANVDRGTYSSNCTKLFANEVLMVNVTLKQIYTKNKNTHRDII